MNFYQKFPFAQNFVLKEQQQDFIYKGNDLNNEKILKKKNWKEKQIKRLKPWSRRYLLIPLIILKIYSNLSLISNFQFNNWRHRIVSKYQNTKNHITKNRVMKEKKVIISIFCFEIEIRKLYKYNHNWESYLILKLYFKYKLKL